MVSVPLELVAVLAGKGGVLLAVASRSEPDQPSLE